MSSVQFVRQLKEERKQERNAQREAKVGQAKRDRELSEKAKIAVSRKITAFESRMRSQTEAAAMLNRVIGAWQRERQGD